MTAPAPDPDAGAEPVDDVPAAPSEHGDQPDDATDPDAGPEPPAGELEADAGDAAPMTTASRACWAIASCMSSSLPSPPTPIPTTMRASRPVPAKRDTEPGCVRPRDGWRRRSGSSPRCKSRSRPGTVRTLSDSQARAWPMELIYGQPVCSSTTCSVTMAGSRRRK